MAAPTVMPATGKTIPELRVGVAGLPFTMDPQELSSNVGTRLYYFTYDTLIRRDFLDGNKLVPGLATEWKHTDDRTWEVGLRRGVVWHDGSPFTAADVKYTFDRILRNDPKLNVSTLGFPIASVDILDDFRLRFISKEVDPLFEKRLTGSDASIIPAKYHQQVGSDAFRVKPIGTGPYRMTEFVADDHISFEAHDRYFGGAPAAKKVIIRGVPEVATRLAAIGNNEVDIITDVPPDQLPTLKGRANVVTKGVALTNIYLFQANMRLKPTDNKFVRQALSLAIDRKTLVETIWNGNAVWTQGYQSEGEDFFNPNRARTPYDPDKAKALLQQGGYAGEPINHLITAPNYYINERETAEAVLGMWRKIGLNVTLDGLELARRLDEQKKPMSKYHLADTSTGSSGDPDGYLFSGDWGPSGFKQKAWGVPESYVRYNQYGQEARTTLDQNKRFDLYQKMLDEWDTEVPAILLYAPYAFYGLRNTIEWTPYANYYMDLRPYNFKVK